jgi:LCP family protein required for cell wall assembly
MNGKRFHWVGLLLLSTFLFFSGTALTVAALWRQSTPPRTNVLILGLDRRPEQNNAVRTDTMMLMTVVPAESYVGLLSIPRDLYVEIPGNGSHRINTAHLWGELSGETDGPALAMETVAQTFEVPVRHYVRVDFEGFCAVVDALGGIDVTVEETIVDNAYPTDDYGTTRIEIPAGPQHMDGQMALIYARTRHASSDFDRAERQQQILVALARRLTDPWVWPRLPAVYRAVSGAMETDMASLDLGLMGLTLLRVGPDAIEHRVIDREMTTSWTTPTGGAVLLPRWDAIRPVVQEMFGS